MVLHNKENKTSYSFGQLSQTYTVGGVLIGVVVERRYVYD